MLNKLTCQRIVSMLNLMVLRSALWRFIAKEVDCQHKPTNKKEQAQQ
jgi:hypothetical protein